MAIELARTVKSYLLHEISLKMFANHCKKGLRVKLLLFLFEIALLSSLQFNLTTAIIHL